MLSVTAHAGAPQQKTQSPGYYRMMLGQFEVTALSDGSSPVPMGQLLTNLKPQEFFSALQKSFQKDPVETTVNAFLINTGPKLVLIDTGAGSLLGPTEGKLLSNLIAAGYRPEQVDEILVTHMHGDHIGGLLSNGKAAFSNAVVHAAQSEADYWLSAEHMSAAPNDLKPFFQTAIAAFKPYQAAGQFKPFVGADTELEPGIHALLAAGHTPGHSTYSVTSGGEQLLIFGDLVHVAAVQFSNPTVTIHFDTDASAAAAARIKVFTSASEGSYWVGGAHIPFPGIGHVRKDTDGSGFVFVPVIYRSIP